MSTEKVLKRRRREAVVLVVALLLALGVARCIEEKPAGIFDQDNLDNGILPGEIQDVSALSAVDASSLIDQAEAALKQWVGEVPHDFTEELGILPEAFEIRVYEYQYGCVVGYVLPGEAHDVQLRLEESLRCRRWVSTPLGSIEGATFVKNEGRYGWALSTCTQVGDKVSVVVRCLLREGDRQ